MTLLSPENTLSVLQHPQTLVTLVTLSTTQIQAPGGILGWTYTTDNNWHTFGAVSLDEYGQSVLFDKVGVATDALGESTVLIGSGSTQVSIDGTGGVGIGTTANGFKLHVFGGNIRGTFEGDGSATDQPG